MPQRVKLTSLRAAGTDGLGTSASPVSAYPFTLSAWGLYFQIGTSFQTLMSIAQRGVTNQYAAIARDDNAGGYSNFAVVAVSGGSSVSNVDPAARSGIGQWHHVALAVSGATSRKLYVDGVLAVTGTASRSFGTLNCFNFFSGDTGANAWKGWLALPAIHNAELTEAHIRRLAAGAMPWRVAPYNFATAWPDLGSRRDVAGSYPIDANLGTPRIVVSQYLPPVLARHAKRPRRYVFLSPAAGGTKALEGGAVVGAQASAALTVAKALAGDAAGSSQASAALAIAKLIAGGADVSGLAAAGITVGKTLAGAATGAVSASGALSLDVPLAGAAVGGAAATGSLSLGVALTGAAVVSAGAQGSLSTGLELSGAAIAGATAAGQLYLGIALSAGAIAGALAQGSLTVSGDSTLEGTAVAGATADATLKLDVHLAGTSLGSADAGANLSIAMPLTAAALTSAEAEGALTVLVSLAADALTESLAAGTLQIEVQFAGDAVGGAIASATFPTDGSAITEIEFTALRARTMHTRLGSRTLTFRMH